MILVRGLPTGKICVKIKPGNNVICRMERIPKRAI
jgi:hypothetical protein